MVFAAALASLPAVVDPPQPILSQWLASILLGAHTKHYTGMQRVLKGWCASIRWADKVMHGDFIHTAQGHPIYFEWVDNYDDLRVRFRPLIERMRATLDLDESDPLATPRTLTIVVDRGIYSNELFSLVAADPGLHLRRVGLRPTRPMKRESRAISGSTFSPHWPRGQECPRSL